VVESFARFELLLILLFFIKPFLLYRDEIVGLLFNRSRFLGCMVEVFMARLQEGIGTGENVVGVVVTDAQATPISAMAVD